VLLAVLGRQVAKACNKAGKVGLVSFFFYFFLFIYFFFIFIFIFIFIIFFVCLHYKQSCEIVMCNSALEALPIINQAYESSPFDCVVTDIQMESVDGVELAAIVRMKVQREKKLFFLVCSFVCFTKNVVCLFYKKYIYILKICFFLSQDESKRHDNVRTRLVGVSAMTYGPNSPKNFDFFVKKPTTADMMQIALGSVLKKDFC
jgi:CheY-like chemotaxis protein